MNEINESGNVCGLYDLHRKGLKSGAFHQELQIIRDMLSEPNLKCASFEVDTTCQGFVFVRMRVDRSNGDSLNVSYSKRTTPQESA